MSEGDAAAKADTDATEAKKAQTTEGDQKATEKEESASETTLTEGLNEEDIGKAGGEGAPQDDYAEFTLPEDSTLDQELLADFKSLAREDDLSQEKAQRYVDYLAARLDAQRQSQLDMWKKTCDEWQATLMKDPDYGGTKLKKTIADAQKVVRAHGTKELVADLKGTGFGDNPHLIKMLAKIANAMGEDSFVQGEPPPPPPKTKAEMVYPTQGK